MSNFQSKRSKLVFESKRHAISRALGVAALVGGASLGCSSGTPDSGTEQAFGDLVAVSQKTEIGIESKLVRKADGDLVARLTWTRATGQAATWIQTPGGTTVATEMAVPSETFAMPASELDAANELVHGLYESAANMPVNDPTASKPQDGYPTCGPWFGCSPTTVPQGEGTIFCPDGTNVPFDCWSTWDVCTAVFADCSTSTSVSFTGGGCAPPSACP